MLGPLLITLLLAAESPPAPTACAQSFEQTQRLRREGQLRRAYDEAVRCAQPSCPDFVRARCIDWVAELEASVPTVVFDVRDGSGLPVEGVRVEVDGAPLVDRPQGRAVPVDPGTRRFRLVGPRGEIAERTQVVVEGRRNQVVEARFVATPPEAPAPPASPGRPASVGAAVLTAVAVAGVASFGYFAVQGRRAKQGLAWCAPRCPGDLRAPIERDFLVADVSLAVGLTAGVAAAWLWTF